MQHIICFGNPLHGDDGFGSVVYQRLANISLPDDVRIYDAGTPGLNAMVLFEHCDEVIIVDAFAPHGMPGRLHYLTPEQLSDDLLLPSHGTGVAFLLRSVKALNHIRPTINIIAVEAESIAPFQPGLSLSVTRAVDKVEAFLLNYAGLDCHA